MLSNIKFKLLTDNNTDNNGNLFVECSFVKFWLNYGTNGYSIPAGRQQMLSGYHDQYVACKEFDPDEVARLLDLPKHVKNEV